MNDKNDRDPLEGLSAPRVPAALERRVLGAAAVAMDAAAPATIWDRLWESRTLRLAWVSATFGVLLANVGLTLLPRGPQPTDVLSVERRQAREVRESLALPVVEISPRAAALALGARRRSTSDRSSDRS